MKYNPNDVKLNIIKYECNICILKIVFGLIAIPGNAREGMTEELVTPVERKGRGFTHAHMIYTCKGKVTDSLRTFQELLKTSVMNENT